MRHEWVVAVVLVGCAGRDEPANKSLAALSTPTVIRQEPGYAAANGVVQGGPSWLGRCDGTDFVAAGDIRTGLEPHRVVDGGVELIRDLVPGPRFSLMGSDGFACTDAGARWIGGAGGFGLGTSFLWRSDGTAIGTAPVRPLSGTLRTWSGGLLLATNTILSALEPDGTTRQLSPAGELVEGPDGQLYVSASSIGSIWRTDGHTFDGGQSLGSPCGTTSCFTSLRRTRGQLFITTSASSGTGGRRVSRIGDDGGLEIVLPLSNPASPSAGDEFLAFVTPNGSLGGGSSLWAIDDALDAGLRIATLGWAPQQLTTQGRFAWLWEPNHPLEVVDLLAPTPVNEPVLRPDGGVLGAVRTVVRLPRALVVNYGNGALASVTAAAAIDLVAPGATPRASELIVDGDFAYFTRSTGARSTLHRTDGTVAGTIALGTFETTTAITQIDLLGTTPAGPSALISDLAGARLVRVAPNLSTDVISPSPTNLTGLPPFNFSVEVPGGVVYSSSRGGNELSTWDGTDGGVRAAGSGVLTRLGSRAIIRGQTSVAEATLTSTTVLHGDAGVSFVGGDDELLFGTLASTSQTLWSQAGTSAPVARYSTTITALPITAAARVNGRLVAAAPAFQQNGAVVGALITLDPTGDAGVMARFPPGSAAISFLYPLGSRNVAVGVTGLGSGTGGVWATNGVDAGLIWSGSIVRAVSGGTQVFFAGRATDGGQQASWWSTDGTAAGTVELTTAIPPVDAPLNYLTDGLQWVMREPGNGLFFFAAGDELGNEPWVTDGTVAGTARVADLNPGSGSSNPRNFFRRGDDVFFVATTAQGEAIYHLSVSGMPMGGGTSGTGGGTSGTGGGTSGTGGGTSGTGGGTSGTGGGTSGTGGGTSGTGGGTSGTGGGTSGTGGGTAGGSAGGGEAATPACSCAMSAWQPLAAALVLSLRRRRVMRQPAA